MNEGRKEMAKLTFNFSFRQKPTAHRWPRDQEVARFTKVRYHKVIIGSDAAGNEP